MIQCDVLVEKYGDQLIKLLVKQISPEKVCPVSGWINLLTFRIDSLCEMFV